MTAADNTSQPAAAEEAPCGPCGEAKQDGTGFRWADLALGVLAVGFGIAIIVMGFDLASGGALAKRIGVIPDASGE